MFIYLLTLTYFQWWHQISFVEEVLPGAYAESILFVQ